MKKTHTTRSAPAGRSRLLRRAYSAEAAAKAGSGCESWLDEGGFFNLRLLIGVFIVMAGVFLALAGLGAVLRAHCEHGTSAAEA